MLYYERILKAFQKHKLQYLIAGGMAVNLHGVPRFTKDVDILIEISEDNLKCLRAVIEDLGLKPRLPVSLDDFLDPKNWARWGREKNLKALSLYNPKTPYEEVDVLWDVGVNYESAKKGRKILKIGSLRLSLVSIMDLIRMKKKAARTQDVADIESLRKLQKAVKLQPGRRQHE
jgi:hypothetical protein